MPDWTKPPPQPLPGAVEPPAPDKIKPTDTGWSDFVNKHLKSCPLPWGPDCKVGLEVKAIGYSESRPVDGSNPDGFNGPTKGWTKDDLKVKTRPPATYKDFRRWHRHYPKIRTQMFALYTAMIRVDCGSGKTWTVGPIELWKPEGTPFESGPLDAYFWVQTSGLMQTPGAHGPVELEWEDDGKTPIWHYPDPDREQLGDNRTTPPPYLLTTAKPLVPPIKLELPPDFKLKSQYSPDDEWNPPPDQEWFRIGDVQPPVEEKAPPARKPRRR